ncbi:hypothetical protein [Providencia hangzhouensis]|uniref:hypothetical protein n=1 Tax=Providencia hangzhouensis TaxID=3031799 RepID=UPI0034DD8B00
MAEKMRRISLVNKLERKLDFMFEEMIDDSKFYNKNQGVLMISFKYKSIITLIFICIILSCLSLLNKGYAFTDKDNIQKVNNSDDKYFSIFIYLEKEFLNNHMKARVSHLPVKNGVGIKKK